MATPYLTVVIPVFNEEATLDELYERLTATLEGMERPYEVIAVDDGSKDGSFERLVGLQEKDSRWRIVQLARNFGQNPAMYAGFDHARGEIVVTMDADLQNPPEEIPKLVHALGDGYDVVSGWREKRQDNLLRRAASHAANTVVSSLTRLNVKDLGSGMKAYRRGVIDRLCMARHHSRYLPAETAWLNAKVGEVKVGHQHRTAGESKYGFFTLFRVYFDMVASVSTAPVKFIALVGFLFSFIGFAMAIRIIYFRIIWGNFNELATVSALFFFLGGVQLLCTSILCEYVSRIYAEVQDRPYYIVGQVVEK